MAEKKQENLIARPPVVVVLGHVDHGKTSLLDYIRKSHVVEKESGGITQHIGAYEVALPAGRQEHQEKKITFIDTPGHEAFSAMRSRGAKVADIAVLVVAADEGVKPQTKEAISHLKKTGIPIIAAINKIDRPGADPEKVKRELAKQEVLVESLGGKTPSVETSAQTGQGVPELLELILLVAEMEGLKADVSLLAEGVVIESYLDAQRGPTATLILRNGTLKKDDVLGTNSVVGKVKIMENFQGRPIKKAFPSMPVVVLGLENAPGLGEKFKVFPSLEKAEKELSKKTRPTPPKFEAEPDKKVLNLILKVDVLGSLGAIEELFKNIPQEKAVLRIIKSGVGGINESDVKLAKGARAVIVGFRVKAGPVAQSLAERERIKIMSFEVIYELAQAIREILEKKVEPEKIRLELGKVKVLAIFLSEKKRQIIGGKIIEGEAKRGSLFDICRNEEKIGTGKIIELERNKKKTDKVTKGSECGILYEGNAKIEEGDVLQTYIEEKRKREL